MLFEATGREREETASAAQIDSPRVHDHLKHMNEAWGEGFSHFGWEFFVLTPAPDSSIPFIKEQGAGPQQIWFCYFGRQGQKQPKVGSETLRSTP